MRLPIMKKLRSCLFLIFLTAYFYPANCQESVYDTAWRKVFINYDIQDNKVSFTSLTPLLEPIAGAPEAFYTYYWEFGDGTYSFDEKPVHVYNETGEYTARLWATNNYDNGKPPPSRPKKVPVQHLVYDPETSGSELDEYNGFQLQKNREPMPDEEMVMILSYKNQLPYPASGKLYVFYNEKNYKINNFEITDIRSYHGETELIEPGFSASNLPENGYFTASTASGNLNYLPPYEKDNTSLSQTLDEAKFSFKDVNIFGFYDMQPDEERNMFFTLKTPPEMLKDTSAIIKIRGIFIPDKEYENHKIRDLEMEIVKSHDPNKMSVSDSHISYRWFRNKKLNYKVRFQNNGQGPANSIRLDVDIANLLDPGSIEIVDMYPKCVTCLKGQEHGISCLDTIQNGDQVSFIFHNVHLPGTRQKNVHKKDSTKGFVKYSIGFREKIPKKITKCRTAIIFDNNEPVNTNYTRTRFNPGLSLGVKAGYSMFPKLDKSSGFFFGLTLSPYKSYRGYFQAELMTDFGSYAGSEVNEYTIYNDGDTLNYPERWDMTETYKYNEISLYIVPASYRYNLTDFFALGTGLQIHTKIRQKETLTTVGENWNMNDLEVWQRNEERDIFHKTEEKTRYNTFNTGIFLDLTVGSIRIGPCIGARYILNFGEPYAHCQLYATWKF